MLRTNVGCAHDNAETGSAKSEKEAVPDQGSRIRSSY